MEEGEGEGYQHQDGLVEGPGIGSSPIPASQRSGRGMRPSLASRRTARTACFTARS